MYFSYENKNIKIGHITCYQISFKVCIFYKTFIFLRAKSFRLVIFQVFSIDCHYYFWQTLSSKKWFLPRFSTSCPSGALSGWFILSGELHMHIAVSNRQLFSVVEWPSSEFWDQPKTFLKNLVLRFPYLRKPNLK